MSNSIYNPFSPLRYIHPRASGLMAFKGGGGDAPQTVESIPEWYKPFVEKAASGAIGAYESGDLSKVAGLNKEQNDALAGLTGAANRAETNYAGAVDATGVLSDAATGQGIYGAGATQGLKNKAIRDSQRAYAPMGDQIASSNSVGGARSNILANDRDAGLAAELAGIDYQDLEARRSMSTGAANQIIGNTDMMNTAGSAGSNILGEVGGMKQDQSQREMDANYQGLQRLGGLLSGAPQPSQQAVASGGK
jgi:hypothetical protein